MTKTKSIITRLVLALVVLTLISFCFLGKTFARYTSGSEGTASVTVAKWNVTLQAETDTDSTSVSFGTLSPSDAEYSSTAVRSNTTAPVLVATITNGSDVDAKVTLAVGDAPTVTKTSTDYGNYQESDVLKLFGVTLYSATTKTASADDLTEYTGEVTLSAGGTLYIYAALTWTSADTADSNGDALDTWVGENVTSVEYTLKYTATQASVLPAAATEQP